MGGVIGPYFKLPELNPGRRRRRRRRRGGGGGGGNKSAFIDHGRWPMVRPGGKILLIKIT